MGSSLGLIQIIHTKICTIPPPQNTYKIMFYQKLPPLCSNISESESTLLAKYVNTYKEFGSMYLHKSWTDIKLGQDTRMWKKGVYINSVTCLMFLGYSYLL